MRHVAIVVSILAAAVTAPGCAANPEPGDPGYAYNVDGAYEVEFDVDAEVYLGEVEVSTGPGGAVEGEFLTESPATVVGEFTGQVVGDRLSFQGPYAVQEAGCEGTIDGSGTIAEGGERVTGDFATEGACGTLFGTFVFER